MTNGAKFALGSVAAFVLAIGVELLYIHHKRAVEENAPAVSRTPAQANITDDEVAQYTVHREHPDSLKDERKWIGKTLWVSAGDQLDYYKDTGKHVDYAKPVGVLRGAEPMQIKDVFEQVPPATGRAVMRVAAGQKHVLMAFTLPDSADPKQLYATPVGNYDGSIYNFITDDVFFYDDPHTIFKHWPADVWQHIAKHDVALGMTENQCMMSLGQVITPHGDTAGDRTVTFNNGGKPIDIDFQGGKAVKITPAS